MRREILDKYFEYMSEEGLYLSRSNLKYYLEFLFRDFDFQGKRVLDIGAGGGVYGFFAFASGAKHVDLIEPLYGDKLSKSYITANHVCEQMGAKGHVTLHPITFQMYSQYAKPYDIVIMHNSINHLDESACEILAESSEAQERYQTIFRKLHELIIAGGVLIVCDCSRFNFFASLGIVNPFAKSIEWNKHQAPDVWISLLEKVGFGLQELSWTSYNSLGYLGRIVLGNKFASYFLRSHFYLRMKAK